MKMATVLCFFFISVSSVFAQEIDDRLLSKYSQEELELMISTDVDQYNLLDYALDNAVYIANYSKEKGGDFKTIQVDIDSPPNFIELNLELSDQNQYFKVEGLDKLLVVKSTTLLIYEMKKK